MKQRPGMCAPPWTHTGKRHHWLYLNDKTGPVVQLVTWLKAKREWHTFGRPEDVFAAGWRYGWQASIIEYQRYTASDSMRKETT
jgi:hypothetical protein